MTVQGPARRGFAIWLRTSSSLTRYLAIKYLENDKQIDGVIATLPNAGEIAQVLS